MDYNNITAGSFGAILRKSKNIEILLFQRFDNYKWNLPGGGVNKEETPRNALIREVKEETGYEVIPLWQIGGDYINISSSGKIEDIARIFFCIVVKGRLRKTSESRNYGWYSLENLPTIEIVSNPCIGYPEGRTKAMINDALKSYVFNSLPY